MKNIRRLLAAALALCIMAGVIVWPEGIHKAQAEIMVDGDYEYKVLTDDGTIQITAYHGSEEHVQVPAEIDGMKVASIGNNAFYDCQTIVTVTIPSGVSSMEGAVFVRCPGLQKITIPATVTKIDPQIVIECTSLTAIEADEENPYYTFEDGVLYNKDKTELMKYPAGKSGNFTVPAGVESIADYAFDYSCVSQIEIADSVTSIGKSTFCFCDKMTAFLVGENNQFYSSDEGVLYNKDRTELIQYPSSAPADSYSIPPGVSRINEMAFYNCGILKEIHIPSSVNRIGELGIYCNRNLEAVYTDPDNPAYSSDAQGVLYNKDRTELIRCPEKINGSYLIPDGVVRILPEAFFCCTDLRDITIPDSVTYIGGGAFYACNSLTKIQIPSGVTEIDASAFRDCVNLTAVEADSGNNTYVSDGGILFNREKTELILYPPGRTGRYVIPDGVENIGVEAFYGCFGLDELVIADSVRNIGSAAFAVCTGLTEVTLPEGVGRIGIEVFAGCANLKKIQIPGSVQSIEEGAFAWCGSLERITLPAGVTSIGQGAFRDCTGLTEAVIPSGVTRINGDTFYGCGSLETVTISQKVTAIGTRAFFHCAGLKRVYFDGTRTQWDQIRKEGGNQPLTNAALHCGGGTEEDEGKDYEYTELEDGTLEITKYTGSGTQPEIPAQIGGKRVSSITGSTFKDNMSVTRITVPDGVERIGQSVFSGCGSLAEVDLPASVVDIKGSMFKNCPALEQIRVDPDHPDYLVEDGILYDKEKTTLIKCPAKGKTGSYQIPSGVTVIGSCAFMDCAGLTDIAIPASVRELQSYAFKNCTGLKQIVIPDGISQISTGLFENCTNLSEIILPDSVKIIYYHAFRNCESLSEIVLPEHLSRIAVQGFENCTGLKKIVIPDGIKEIELLVFKNCSNLEEVILPPNIERIRTHAFAICSSLKNVVIPDGVKIIDPSAFWNCTELNYVIMPVSLTSISDRAFLGCYALSDIYYAGTREQWEQIEGSSSLKQPVIHFADGTTMNGPQKEDYINTAKRDLAALKDGDPLGLERELSWYLSPQQLDTVESYLFTWLAETDFAYRYQGSTGVKRRLMAKAGLDPDGDYSAGGRAVTHITVDTVFGPKSIEITLESGAPDKSGHLYTGYGAMHYEILETGGLPESVPKAGTIGKSSYADMAAFVDSVAQTDVEMLHHIYQWQMLPDDMTAGILMDKTIMEITGIQNGSFYDGVYTVYEMAAYQFAKKVTIACPVDVYVRRMDGSESGSIVNDVVNTTDQNVRMEVNGSSKTVYLTKDDYYINLEGTGNGTMDYRVEEITNDETKRVVEFLQIQLKKDLQYEGYVFEPLNIDKELYALRSLDGSGTVIGPDSDSYHTIFKKITGLTLNQSGMTMDTDRTIQLNAGIYPPDASSPKLSWSVDGSGVVSVGSDGLVTALGAGRATVTVSTLDGSNLKASCVVVVAQGTGGNVKPQEPSGPPREPPSGWTPPGQTGPLRPTGPSAPAGPSGTDSTVPTVTKPTAPEVTPPPVVVELYYILRFEANGGTGLSRQTMTLLKNDSPGILPKVRRDGYYFTGWYTRPDGGTRISGDTAPEGAATLYAGWARVHKPEKVKALALKAVRKKTAGTGGKKAQTKKNGQIDVRFQKVSGADGYQIVYAAGRKLTVKKAAKVSVSSASHSLKKLKKGRSYAVKVRAYRLDSAGNPVYGPYSKVKRISI